MQTLSNITLPSVSSSDFWEICRNQFPQEYDYLVSLVRAFRDARADYILIDSRRKQFQILATQLASSLGLLFFREIGSDEEQYTAWEYRLTDLGKQVVLDSRAPSEYIS